MRRTTIFLIIIFLVSLTIRLIYTRSHPPQILPDTYGYYLIGQRIVSGQMPVINPQRTPGYPLFLQLTYKLVGQEKSDINSPEFWRGAQASVFIQIVFSSLGVMILSWLINRLTKSIGITIVLGLVLITNELTFVWDSILVVESLATSWLIISNWWVYLTLIKPTRGRITVFILLGWLGFLIKPVFLGLPIIWLFFINLRTMSLRSASWRRRGNPIGKLLIFCLFMLLPLTYVAVNNYYFHYLGINHVQDINLLGRIIKDRLNPAAGEEISPELTGKLSEYLQTNQPADPYLFLTTADPTLLTDDRRQADRNRLKPWVNTIILSNFPQYLTGVIRDLPSALISLQDLTLQKPIVVFDLLRQLHSLLLVIFTLLILVLTFPALIFWWRGKISPEISIILILHLTVWYMLVASVALGYGEYARLMTPIQPVVYFLGVWWTREFKMQKSKWKMTMQNEKF